VKLKIPLETKLSFLIALILLISVYNINIAIGLLVVGIIFILIQNNYSIETFYNYPCIGDIMCKLKTTEHHYNLINLRSGQGRCGWNNVGIENLNFYRDTLSNKVELYKDRFDS